MMLAFFLTTLLYTNPITVGITNINGVLYSAGSTNTTSIVAYGCNLSSNNVAGAVFYPAFLPTYPAGYFTKRVYAFGLSNQNSTVFFGTNVGNPSITFILANATNSVTASVNCGLLSTTNASSYSYTSFSSYTNPPLAPSTNCYVQYLVSQLQGLTNSATAATNDFLYQVNNNNGLPSVLINSNSWLYGVTNIMCVYVAQLSGSTWSDNYQYIPISQHYCVSAAHVHNLSPSRIYVLPSGNLYTNYAIDSTATGDLEVDLMANTNPAWVRVMQDVYPYWTFVYSNEPVYVREHTMANSFNGWQSTFNSFAATNDNGEWTFVHYIQPNGISQNAFQANPYFGDYSQGDQWIAGDSSSPAWAILGNEAILMGVATDPQDAEVNDTNTVNPMIAYLAAKDGAPLEQATPYPIWNFYAISPQATNATFTATPLIGLAPLDVNFTFTGSNGVTFLWSFGDGTTSTAQNPSHTYLTAGTNTVSLVVNGYITNTMAAYVAVTNSPSGAPTNTFYAANYGVVGDAQNIFVTTVSNSVSVTDTNANFQSTDTNKLMVITFTSNLSAAGTISCFGYITNVVSSHVVQLSSIPQFTGGSLNTWYGTWDEPGMSNTVAACNGITNATIIMPSGHILMIPPQAVTGTGDGDKYFAGMILFRGGLTFTNASTNCVWVMNPAPFRGFQGGQTLYRGYAVCCHAPMTNDYPLIFANMIFDGGWSNVLAGGPSQWDSQCHWMDDDAYGVGGATPIISSIVMDNMIVRHIAGEGMEHTVQSSENVSLTINNCEMFDIGGSCINNYRMTASSSNNILHDSNFGSEYDCYSSSNANWYSYFIFSNLTTGVTMPGNDPANPTITVDNCTFAGCQGAVEGASNMRFLNNTWNGSSSSDGVVFMTSSTGQTYQNWFTNVVVASNFVNGAYCLINFANGWTNTGISVFSNVCENLGYLSVQGNSTNTSTGVVGYFEPFNWVTNNLCTNVAANTLNSYGGPLKGHWPIFANNNGYNYTIPSNGTNMYYFTADDMVAANAGNYYLTNDARIVNGSIFTISNTAASTITVYNPATSTSLGTVANGAQHVLTYSSGWGW